tara:strand:+ start:237 stop:449 length:213 start_codon:yes stop_codon:yes gene_type:complete
MTHQELEYLKICTKSHKRDLEEAKLEVTYFRDQSNIDIDDITNLLDKIQRGIDMMYATLEAETSEVKDND